MGHSQSGLSVASRRSRDEDVKNDVDVEENSETEALERQEEKRFVAEQEIKEDLTAVDVAEAKFGLCLLLVYLCFFLVALFDC